MGRELLKYHISPRVVRADTLQTITVKGLDGSSRFYDDCEYFAKVYPLETYNFKKDRTFPGGNDIPEIRCACENGTVTFDYFFEGEQEWIAHIYRKETEKHRNPMYDHHGKAWQHLIDRPLTGVKFSLYSLNADLYERRPLKGDLHIHTDYTDGDESPAMTAALYREAGYDFIGITDHHVFEPCLQAIEAFRDIPTDFQIYPGEEVHNGYGGYFHTVNFGCKESVCRRVMEEREQVEQEVDAIEAELELPEGLDRREMAWRTWIHRSIKASGGISILPHPYAIIGGVYNIQTKVCKAIFEMGLCDAFEILGGLENPARNRRQAALYTEALADGIDLPIVGSNDTHHPMLGHSYKTFDHVFTLAFAKNAESVQEAVLNRYTVAVDNNVRDSKTVYGRQRLVNYAWFLIENYYDAHDALCADIGHAILRHLFGAADQKQLIVLLEEELKKYNRSFFGA